MHFNYSLGPDPQLAPNCHTRSGELAPFATLLHIAAFPSSKLALLHSSHMRRSCHCPIPAALPHRPCVHWFSPSSFCVSPSTSCWRTYGAPCLRKLSFRSSTQFKNQPKLAIPLAQNKHFNWSHHPFDLTIYPLINQVTPLFLQNLQHTNNSYLVF